MSGAFRLRAPAHHPAGSEPPAPWGSAPGMSMTAPMEPGLPGGDDGIPAADAGNGAPPPATGFGVGGEEPDVGEQDPEPDETAPPAGMPTETPFRTPDPTELAP